MRCFSCDVVNLLFSGRGYGWYCSARDQWPVMVVLWFSVSMVEYARRVCCFEKGRWWETEFANESVKTGWGWD
jgi:hypothetical protein